MGATGTAAGCCAQPCCQPLCALPCQTCSPRPVPGRLLSGTLTKENRVQEPDRVPHCCGVECQRCRDRIGPRQTPFCALRADATEVAGLGSAAWRAGGCAGGERGRPSAAQADGRAACGAGFGRASARGGNRGPHRADHGPQAGQEGNQGTEGAGAARTAAACLHAPVGHPRVAGAAGAPAGDRCRQPFEGGRDHHAADQGAGRPVADAGADRHVACRGDDALAGHG